MLGNGIAGTLGIVVQVAAFLFVVLLSSARVGRARALVYGSVVAVYGYALVVSFLFLFAVPWQITNFLLALAIGTALAARSVRKATLAYLPEFLASLGRSWAAVAVVSAMVLIQVFAAAIQPELSIDGQLYHGPALANMVQSGTLWGWSVPNQYVYYTDLTMAGGVNLATFAGDARFDNALQVPHLLVLMFVINWALAQRMSSSFLRVSLAALIIAAPVIWLQPRILYVDLAYGAAVAAAIFFVVLVRDFRRFDILIAGILLGAVFATKPTGILSGLILLLVLVVAVVLRRRRLFTAKSTLLASLIGFGLPLVFATSAYVRNLVQFGNPVYPVQVKLGPIFLPGILDLSVFASGERGDGLVDISRWVSYASNIAYGMANGVTKLDYDPRAGGFGYVPLLVLLLAVVLVSVQLVLRWRRRTAQQFSRGSWRPQVGIIVLSAVLLLVQPATFDARYVIGPTVALLVAVLMTSIWIVPALAAIIVGVLALVLALGQIGWTERHMYPGLNEALYLMRAPASAQPNTPVNPWGVGANIAWLPQGPGACTSIALQTAGGVTPSGMSEASYLGTFPYGLFGDELCNELHPIQLEGADGGPSAEGITGAEFLVLYAQDVGKWEKTYPELFQCMTEVYRIDGTESLPQDEIVFRNTCS